MYPRFMTLALTHGRRPRPRRTLGLAVILLGTVAGSSASQAQEQAPSKEACANAFASSQQLRGQGKLIEARSKMIFCGQSSCPLVVRRECLQAMPELEGMIPSVVFGVRTAEGKDVAAAEITLDGVRQPNDGKSVPLDPGPHKVECEAPGFLRYETTVLSSSGEKNRFMNIVLSPLNPTPAPTLASSAQGRTEAPGPAVTPPPAGEEPPRGLPAATYILGGVAVLSFGAMTYFGLSGFADADDMATSCAPNCEQSKVDAAHTKILIANISFGMGVVAAGGALWTALAAKSDSRKGTSERGALPVALDVATTPGGGFVGMHTRF
jgi:hypothetical protein